MWVQVKRFVGTDVLTIGGTLARMPPENMKIYNLRARPSRWERAKAIAEAKGDRISDVLRRHLDEYIAENEHVLAEEADRG